MESRCVLSYISEICHVCHPVFRHNCAGDLALVEFFFKKNGSIYLRLEGSSFRAPPLFLRKCSLVKLSFYRV